MRYHANCPGSPGKEYAIDVSPGVSAQRVFVVTSIICTVLVCLSMAALAASHIFNYTIPREQRLLLRVIALPMAYSICNLLSVIFYGAAIYLDEIPKIVEAIGLSAVFELYVFYLTPGATTQQRDLFFQTLERRGRWRNNKLKHDKGSLRWFKVTWAMVFQYIPISITFAILTWIFAVHQCPYGAKAQRTKLILELLGAVFITFSILGVLGFERRMKHELRPLGAGRKLWGLKLFVGVSVTLNIAFAILQKFSNIGKKTPHLSYNDLVIGLPDVLFQFAMLVFCFVFWWAYPPTRYRQASRTPDATGQVAARQPVFRGFWDPVNILDVIQGSCYAFKILVKLPLGKKRGIGYRVQGDVEFSPERKALPTRLPAQE